MEREQYQTEIRDLQDQLSEMHDELDSAKKSVADGEKDVIMAVMHRPHWSREEKNDFLFSTKPQWPQSFPNLRLEY